MDSPRSVDEAGLLRTRKVSYPMLPDGNLSDSAVTNWTKSALLLAPKTFSLLRQTGDSLTRAMFPTLILHKRSYCFSVTSCCPMLELLLGSCNFFGLCLAASSVVSGTRDGVRVFWQQKAECIQHLEGACEPFR